jgi:hypothetical protein
MVEDRLNAVADRILARVIVRFGEHVADRVSPRVARRVWVRLPRPAVEARVAEAIDA